MAFSNKLTRLLAKLDRVPSPLRVRARSLLLGRAIPLVGTAGLRFEEVREDRMVVSIANRRPIRNHIGGVHAAAMALVAETATGVLVGLNVPDDGVPVIKTMRVDYRKRARGAMRAVATLTPAQIEAIRTTPKGEVSVAITVTDESGEAPIACEMVWAWIPKKR